MRRMLLWLHIFFRPLYTPILLVIGLITLLLGTYYVNMKVLSFLITTFKWGIRPEKIPEVAFLILMLETVAVPIILISVDTLIGYLKKVSKEVDEIYPIKAGDDTLLRPVD